MADTLREALQALLDACHEGRLMPDGEGSEGYVGSLVEQGERALSTIGASTQAEEARDAARYQWLAENAIIETPRWRHDGKDPASTKHVLDRAINAAMAEEGKHGRPAR